jgi:tetratricopeptide (TPR) repeat protein
MKAYRIITALLLSITFLSPGDVYSAEKDEKDTLYRKATRYFFQKKFEMAELLLQEVIKKNPENVMAYSYLGDIFLKKKRYDGALNLYKKALDINPQMAENHFRIGQIYYYKKLGNMSIESFRKTLELDSKIKYAYYHIGLSYLMLLRDKKNTIENWETYIKIAPEDPQYEKIRRVIELLKDPNFVLPPVGSDISIEEALLLGGSTLKEVERKARDKKAGHEVKKTKEKIEEIYKDDDL